VNALGDAAGLAGAAVAPLTGGNGDAAGAPFTGGNGDALLAEPVQTARAAGLETHPERGHPQPA
jgi:hypothetical protein